VVGKPFTVVIYILCGGLIAFWPIAVQWALAFEAAPLRAVGKWLRPAFKVEFAKLFARQSFGIICGLLIGSTLLWWPARYASISVVQYGIYALLVAFACVLLTRSNRSLMPIERHPGWRGILVVVAILICLVLSFSTGIMTQPLVLLTSWHHWGAFIGPSELMLSGARLFYDFPAQYGFGPTLLIAAFCGENCWIGMHYVVATTTLLFALAILYIIATARIRSVGAFGVLLAIFILICFFWNSYPPLVSSPREVPSVSGLRFLPAVAMVAGLIWIDRISRLAPYWSLLGHTLYAVGALWSPESLFFIGYVWWPYFIWRRCAEAPPARYVRTLLGAVTTLIVVSGVILLGFLATYRFRYGVYPSFDAYFAYMLYPPGETPIDPRGPIWYSAIALALGLLLVTQLLLENKDRQDLRRAILVLLLGYATLSYCMGRSHSNNFLNVAPFSALILIEVFSSQLKAVFKAITIGMLVSLLGWVSTFGWSAWTATIETKRLLEFQPRQFVASFSFERPETAAAVTEVFHQSNAVQNFENISHALSFIRASSKDPIAVVDSNFLLLANTNPQAWSAYHGPGNVYFMPREWRRKFLRRTAERLDSNGWLIIHDAFPPEWLEDFQSVYHTTQDAHFGDYRALHFSTHE
jgi:hypothetical protein